MSKSQKAFEDINNEDINAQLNKILSSPEFTSKQQLGKFLEYVVSETLAGRETHIKQYTVAVKAFERDDNFNPQRDPIVRIEARRLRRVLDSYYRESGKNDPVKIAIPVGAYVPIFLKQSFPPTSGTLDAGDDQAHPTEQAQFPRVALFPFTNLSPNELDDNIVSGIGYEISSNLARFQELSVIAYFSMRQLLGQELNTQEIEEQFGVTYLVTGSIRKSNQQLRVTISMVYTPTQAQLWTQIYDRVLSDSNLFDILDDIVTHIIAVIGSGQGVILRSIAQASPHPRPKSLMVLDAISRYYEMQRNFDYEAFKLIPGLLEKATEVDPKNALVWAVLGEIYSDFDSHDDPMIENASERAEICAAKALNLDPLCQHAHHLLAYIAMKKCDFNTVIEACGRVIELNPKNAYLTGMAGFWLALVGKYDEGKIILKRAMALNPYYPPYFHHAFFLDHYRKGEFLEALEEAENFNMPDYYWDPLDKAIAYSAEDRITEAAAKLEEVRRLIPLFDEKPDTYLKAFIIDDDLRGDMLAKLANAGLVN